MFTRNIGQNAVVHSLDDSLLLVLNIKNVSHSHSLDAVQTIEDLSERLSATVVSFDFIVGDINKMTEIFECLKT